MRELSVRFIHSQRKRKLLKHRLAMVSGKEVEFLVQIFLGRHLLISERESSKPDETAMFN